MGHDKPGKRADKVPTTATSHNPPGHEHPDTEQCAVQQPPLKQAIADKKAYKCGDQKRADQVDWARPNTRQLPEGFTNLNFFLHGHFKTTTENGTNDLIHPLKRGC